MIIGLYPLLNKNFVNLWALIISIILFFLAFFGQRFLNIPNKLWLKFGLFLGSIISPIVMSIIFFLTVTPTGIIMRLLGKDLLLQKLDKSKKTYWINKKQDSNSMKNQF